ncbi:TPA: CDP-glycerol glycerophosphotransferase family protein, partial [Escherichia albertii]|nr:CDP-glycerol glycerophosphotransferase family protein [Escherichia albertii]
GFLSDNNIYLSLRLHPANTAGTDFQKLVNSYSNISLSNESDIYEVINQYDCLITDYSSIMFDFVLSGKPVIFYPYDKEQYLKTERGMYFNYDDIISGGFVVDSWRDIMNVLNDIKERKKIATDNSFLSGFNDEILQNNTSCYSELLCEFVMEKIKFSDV